MPRTKGSPKKCVKTVNPSSNTWVFLMKDEIQKDSGWSSTLVKLKHPGSGYPSMFMFSQDNTSIQEVLTMDEDKRSWFIDDNVVSDGKMYLSTPVDPIFLILPYLRESEHLQPLEQCLWDENYPETVRLASCKNLDLLLVADQKGEDNLRAFKFNEDKTLSWLRTKVERVAEVLKQKNIHVSTGAVSANFVKSTKDDVDSNLDYIKYAHGIVSEYLMEDLSKNLAKYLNLPEDKGNIKKRKLFSPKKSEDKRLKQSTSPNECFVSPPRTKALDLTKPDKSQKNPSKKELAKQKAAASSQNITKFFKKK